MGLGLGLKGGHHRTPGRVRRSVAPGHGGGRLVRVRVGVRVRARARARVRVRVRLRVRVRVRC